jgi:hypothetical protein
MATDSPFGATAAAVVDEDAAALLDVLAALELP